MIQTLKSIVRTTANYWSTGSDLLYRRPSYSQEGEDRVLERYFGTCGPGFYVDVGAHHPHRFSNTYLFYKRGWRGINIDAMPGSMEPFKRMRVRDINLEMGVGAASAVAKFYVFSEPALNTFDEAIAKSHENSEYKITRIVDVPIERLEDILARHLPQGMAIDFLTIDVEGLDLQVLQSNDWTRFRPKVVLVEAVGNDLNDIAAIPTAHFLITNGYKLYAKTVNTLMLVDPT